MENVAPGTMRAVSKELRALNQDPIEGVTVLMNESDLTDIGGVMGLRKFESQIIAVELSPEGGLDWY